MGTDRAARLKGMAQGPTRAAEHFEAEAATLEAEDSARRKVRSGDDSLIVARTMRTAARRLRGWARQCLPEGAGEPNIEARWFGLKLETANR